MSDTTSAENVTDSNPTNSQAVADEGQNVNRTYGTCEGPDAKFVKLISKDEIEFIIEKRFALQSKTIRDMLTGPGMFGPGQTNEIRLDFESHVLYEVCRYMMYKARYDGVLNDQQELPQFILDPRMAIGVLMATNFLDI